MNDPIAAAIRAKVGTAGNRLLPGEPYPTSLEDLPPGCALLRLKAQAEGANRALQEPAARLRRWQQQAAHARQVIADAEADPDEADFLAVAAALAILTVLDGSIVDGSSVGGRDSFGFGPGAMGRLAGRVRDLDDTRMAASNAWQATWGNYLSLLRDLPEAQRRGDQREATRLQQEIERLLATR